MSYERNYNTLMLRSQGYSGKIMAVLGLFKGETIALLRGDLEELSAARNRGIPLTGSHFFASLITQVVFEVRVTCNWWTTPRRGAKGAFECQAEIQGRITLNVPSII